MASISINEVHKTYGTVKVLLGIDLDVQDGEFIVLVGPSGCGKSTLLRMIAGLEEITEGTIRIGDRTINDLPPRQRDIAMVFQSYALYPHMTVAENMSYSLRLRRASKEIILETVSAAAMILGLQSLLERRPKALSGGQRQRVAMGRAIVRKPKAFLFDEPLSNLDARLREQMRSEIRKLHRDLGATSVYVTHDQIEAMTMADRIVAMHDGIIQQIGSPTEIYDRPANKFVASFIGSPAMNFLSARYSPMKGEGLLQTEFGNVMVTPRKSRRENAEVTVGIRPEDIQVAKNNKSGLVGRVEMIEYMGATTLIHLSAGDAMLRVMSFGLPNLQIGADLHFTIAPGKVHLFDLATEQRID